MTELAHRASNRTDVALLWSRRTGRLTVAVEDVRTGESFTFDASNDRALDVFNHPFRVCGHRCCLSEFATRPRFLL